MIIFEEIGLTITQIRLSSFDYLGPAILRIVYLTVTQLILPWLLVMHNRPY